MGEGKLTPVTTPTPLNRQSRHIAHVITSTISPHKPHLVKIAPGVTSPHIAWSYHSMFFLFLSLYAKVFHGPRAQAVEPILSCDISTDAYSRRVVPFGGQKTIISHLHPQNPKKTFLGTYNGKPTGNTYSHNCMMHRDTMLKFGTLFDLAKYFEHTKFSAYGVRQGGSSAHIKF